MDVLIVSVEPDTHASTVAAGIRAREYEPFIWATNKPLYEQELSVTSCDSESEIVTIDKKIVTSKVRSVWYRRPSPPDVSRYFDQDREIILAENLDLYRNVLTVISNYGFWVNPLRSAHLSNNKIYQLRIARNCGFKTPRTIVSNNPSDIVKFAKHIDTKELVYKTFTPVSFNKPYKAAVYATPVSIESINSDKIKNAAAIWQERVPKKYELRIAIFGRSIFSLRIDSQNNQEALNDWRAAHKDYSMMSAATVSNEVKKKCFGVMNMLGLKMGCFDLIVTPSDDVYFLEINQSGQFLWMEAADPKLPMLDAFVDYLIDPNKKYIEKRDSNRLFFKDYSS